MARAAGAALLASAAFAAMIAVDSAAAHVAVSMRGATLQVRGVRDPRVRYIYYRFAVEWLAGGSA